MLAEKENHKCEDQAETDREGEGNDGHDGGRLVVGAAGCSGENDGSGKRATTPLERSAVVMAEQFFRGEPVLEIAARRPATFNPEQVSGVLDLRFGGLGQGLGAGLHGGLGN